jgi:hypothetical protein
VLLVELAELLVRLAVLVFAEERMPSKAMSRLMALLRAKAKQVGVLRAATPAARVRREGRGRLRRGRSCPSMRCARTSC